MATIFRFAGNRALATDSWGFMPMVRITMLQGRAADQKRKIAERITDALVEEAGARREGIIIAFHEVSNESYASGGELIVNKRK